MKSLKSHQGSASALATELKDEKQDLPTNNAAPNTFTEDEKQLAERYKVEPKLIRMIGEIVSEHTESFRNLINLIRGNQELQAETVDQPEPEEIDTPEELQESADKPEPTTGIPQLDKLIDGVTYESQAMAYACLDMCQRDASLGDRITTLLDSSLRSLRYEDKIPKGADFECDIAPAIKWLRFMDGFQAGLISKQSVDQATSTETEQESNNEQHRNSRGGAQNEM